jgi:hypothetical protein
MIRRLLSIAVITAAALIAAQAGGPETFDTPEEARDALIQAASKGMDAVRLLMGPGSAAILRTGDPVMDKNLLESFRHRAAEKTQLAPDQMNPDRVILLTGSDEVPFAVPLVRKDGRWYFDVQQGKEEIRDRFIGGNELDAIQICRGYIAAQRTYAQTDWEGKGVPQYARRIVSNPGKRDGLYWPGNDSPVAAGFARAAAEGYATPSASEPLPYHGYFFKILLTQGPNAAGGVRNYVLQDLMIGGFALVAWPAEYGVSGIKTFIVNQDGVVYEKDLGPQTGSVAKAMSEFNPDPSWQVSP